MSPDELAAAYAAAWLERDAATQMGHLERCCTEDVHFAPYGGSEIVGIEALCAEIQHFQDSWPPDGEVTVELTTTVQEAHSWGRGGFVWIFPGDIRSYGTDFMRLRDGKLETIVVCPDEAQTAA